jgi:hypothetical protein
MANDYVPRSESQLAIWFTNYAKKISIYGPLLGLTANEIKAAETGCNNSSTKITEIEQKKNELQQIVAAKDDARDNTLAMVRGFVIRMKAHPAYNESIGHDLGIIAVNNIADTATNKTMLKAEALPGRVRISFMKKGLSGVNIYTRLHGVAQWSFLARANNSSYDDARPLTNAQPEIREYMAMGVVGDVEIGQPSDIVSVVFVG